MAIMDVFLGDAFSARSLTAAVDRYSYVPNFLETLPGLFTQKPIRTAEVWIEERDFAPALIQTSPRGAAPSQRGGEQRKARAFMTTRIGDRVMRRTFGAAVPGLLGQNLTPSTLLRFYTAIAIAIELWEPRFRVRRFEYPGPENGPDDLRQGRLGIRMVGDYRPRALLGDLSVETVRTVAL